MYIYNYVYIYDIFMYIYNNVQIYSCVYIYIIYHIYICYTINKYISFVTGIRIFLNEISSCFFEGFDLETWTFFR